MLQANIYIYIYIFYVYLYANIYQKKFFFMLKNLIKPKPSKGTIFVSIILKKQFFVVAVEVDLI